MTVVTLLAACSESTATEPMTVIDTWTLATVDAKTVPTTVYADDGYSLEVTGGEITLAADGTYANDVTVRETVDGYVSIYVDHVTGRWAEPSAGGITLTPTGEAPMAATWAGASLTVKTPDFTLVYSRTP